MTISPSVARTVQNSCDSACCILVWGRMAIMCVACCVPQASVTTSPLKSSKIHSTRANRAWTAGRSSLRIYRAGETGPDFFRSYALLSSPIFRRVNSFLCSAIYYFVASILEMPETLRRLLRRYQMDLVIWMQSCIEQIIVEFASSRLFDNIEPNLKPFMSIEASTVAFGPVLSHLHGNGEDQVAFGSRTFTSSEGAYWLGKREELAMLSAALFKK